MQFDLDDFLDNFNWLDRLNRLVFTGLSLLPHRDLRGHWQLTPGLVQMCIERCDQNEQINQTGGEAERLLRHYGIPIHGRRVRHREFILAVPAQQANWAEYLLANRFTMAASHRWFNPANKYYALRRGSCPVPAWADRKEPLP